MLCSWVSRQGFCQLEDILKMPINRPNSFSSTGKAKMPGAGTDFGTIEKIEGEDNVVITPSSGQGNVTVALSVNTALVQNDPVTVSAGRYKNGSQVLLDFKTGLSLTAGQMYYWTGTNTWALAENTTTFGGLIAMCSDTTDGSEMVYKGIVQSKETFTAGEMGAPLYLDASGNLTTTIPTAQFAIVQIMGYAKGTGGLIYLDVSNDYYQIP